MLAEQFDRRTGFYALLTWIMICVLIASAVYFSVANNDGKIDFSRTHNDIYEVEPVAIMNGVACADNPDYLEFAFVVYFDSMDLNFLEIEADGITTEEVSFLGQNEEGVVQFTTDWQIMSDGKNYIEIPSDEFAIARIYINGGKKETIKSIRFIESKEEPLNSKALLYAIAVTAAFIILSICTVKIAKGHK